MKDLINTIVLSIENIAEKYVPKVQGIVESRIISKLSDKGLKLLYWVSCIISKVFLVSLLFGLIQNVYLFFVNGSSWTSSWIPYSWMTAFFFSLVIPVIIDFVGYVAIRVFTKVIERNLEYEIDESGVLFATGVYYIIINVKGLFHVVESFVYYVYSVIIIDSPMQFTIQFVNSLFVLIFMYIGYRFIKASGYLTNRVEE